MNSNGLCCFLGEDLLQIRGQNGLLHTCMDPLPEVADKQEVADTAEHVLKSFYPVSPTIDLQKVNVYKEVNSTGEDTHTPVLCFWGNGVMVVYSVCVCVVCCFD